MKTSGAKVIVTKILQKIEPPPLSAGVARGLPPPMCSVYNTQTWTEIAPGYPDLVTEIVITVTGNLIYRLVVGK